MTQRALAHHLRSAKLALGTRSQHERSKEKTKKVGSNLRNKQMSRLSSIKIQTNLFVLAKGLPRSGAEPYGTEDVL